MKALLLSILGLGLFLLPLVAAQDDLCEKKKFYIDQCSWLQRRRPMWDHFGHDEETSVCDGRSANGNMKKGENAKVYPYDKKCTIFYDMDSNDAEADEAIAHMDCEGDISNVKCKKAPEDIYAAYCGFFKKPHECTHRLYCEWQECKAFEPGWCGAHIRQYQKNEGPGKDTSVYRYDVRLYDGSGSFASEEDLIGIADGKTYTVKSPLPHGFDITSGHVDDDPVTMSYNGATWKSDNDRHCKWGAYDSGHRDGDCGFTC